MVSSKNDAPVIGVLNASETAILQSRGQLIANAATTTITPGKFIFFAAFDGTRNDRGNVALSDTPQETNVAQLERQVAKLGNKNVAQYYAPGVGTGGINGGPVISAGPLPTDAVVAAAEAALKQFTFEAKAWLDANKSEGKTAADLSGAMTGFSRGCATAIVFAQLLQERGLKLPDGTVVAQPGVVKIESTLLFDPVFSNIDRNLAIPENVIGNVAVIRAADEYRYFFKGADLSNDARVVTITASGNHGNIGGMYDNGIGAIMLEGATQFFSRSGLSNLEVSPDRKYDPTKPLNVYSAAIDSYGNRVWDEYGAWGVYGTRGTLDRLYDKIPLPQLGSYNPATVLSVYRIENSVYSAGDPTKTVIITFKNGDVVRQLVDSMGAVVLSTQPGGTITRDATTGSYSILNANTGESRSYNPASREITFMSPSQATIVTDHTGSIIRIIEPADGSSSSQLIDGESFEIAANGVAYRERANGVVEIRDGVSASGVFAQVAVDGKLQVQAFYQPTVDLNGKPHTLLFDSTTGAPIGQLQTTLLGDGRAWVELSTDQSAQTRTIVYDAKGDIEGLVNDVKNSNGSVSRNFVLTVDGYVVSLNQILQLGNESTSSSQTEYKTTSFQINGETAMYQDLLIATIDKNFDGPNSILLSSNRGLLSALVQAGNPANSTGYSAPSSTQPSNPQAWYETPEAQRFGDKLTEVQSLISALKGGKPLPIR